MRIGVGGGGREEKEKGIGLAEKEKRSGGNMPRENSPRIGPRKLTTFRGHRNMF